MVRPFDRAFVDEAIGTLRSIPEGARPLWGSMSPAQMRAHLMTAVRYSLGKEPITKNEGGVFGARVAAPLILGGYMRIPKNQKAPKMYDAQAPSATVEELALELEEFLARYQDPGFTPPAQPYFGDIGKAGWGRMHIVHVEHHLRQFGKARKGFVKG